MQVILFCYGSCLGSFGTAWTYRRMRQESLFVSRLPLRNVSNTTEALAIDPNLELFNITRALHHLSNTNHSGNVRG